MSNQACNSCDQLSEEGSWVGGGGSWPLAQPQSNVQPPPLCLPLSGADSPAMTFSAFLPASLFIFLFSSSPLLGGDLLGPYLLGLLKAPMLLCGSFRAVGSFRTGKGSESTHSRVPPLQTAAGGQGLPDNGGKPGFRQTGILTLNPPLAGRVLNFSEPQFPPGLHGDTRACPRILFSSEAASEKFLVGGGHVQYMLVSFWVPPTPLPSSASLHPPGGLMLPISCFSPGLVLLSLNIEDLLNSMEKTVP